MTGDRVLPIATRVLVHASPLGVTTAPFEGTLTCSWLPGQSLHLTLDDHGSLTIFPSDLHSVERVNAKLTGATAAAESCWYCLTCREVIDPSQVHNVTSGNGANYHVARLSEHVEEIHGVRTVIRIDAVWFE